MNILITGAGGFIESHLYNHLKDKYNFTRIFSSNHIASGKKCHFVDLTKITQVETLAQDLSNANIEAVIHLASRMVSPDTIGDMSIFKDNISITENMALLIKKLRPQLLIHFSSMAVYPNVSGCYSEESLSMPQKNNDCLYGLSKISSEVLLDFILRNEDIRIAHLRVAQVYGYGMRQDRIIPVMQKELEQKNIITVYGNGERQSCFIEIGKLVKIINYLLNNKVSGVFNIGDENISYNDLAKKIVERHGNSNSSIIKTPQGNKEKFNLDTSKLQDIIKV